jgi:hypothetical protein
MPQRFSIASFSNAFGAPSSSHLSNGRSRASLFLFDRAISVKLRGPRRPGKLDVTKLSIIGKDHT